MKNFSINIETGEKIPSFPYEEMKISALGKEYNLSLVFTDSERMKKLNLIYRNKNQSTDILSFPLNETEGEIYICLNEARKESKKFERNLDNFIAFLFIHGLVHLKGYDHGSKMEAIEVKLREEFKI